MSNKSISYVAGFMFSACLTQVALIRKQKPDWQKGKLNGIGGKVESMESPCVAMAREFIEESGFDSRPTQWTYFLEMFGENDNGEPFRVDFFHMIGDVDCLESQEAEKLEIISVHEITPLREDLIDNLAWVIALALDNLKDGRPSFVSARYEKFHGC